MWNFIRGPISFGGSVDNPPVPDPNPYPNSVWNEDGSFNCAGIFYCAQPIPCGE